MYFKPLLMALILFSCMNSVSNHKDKLVGNWYYFMDGDYYEIYFSSNKFRVCSEMMGLSAINSYEVKEDTLLFETGGNEKSIYLKAVKKDSVLTIWNKKLIKFYRLNEKFGVWSDTFNRKNFLNGFRNRLKSNKY